MVSQEVHTSPSDVRALFPAIANAAWLNAAASSPLCEPVSRALTEHIQDTMLRGDADFMRWLARKESIREQIARFLGAEQASEIAFTPNTSMGFHAVARMFKARGIKEVVTLEAEFPSTTIPLLSEGLTLRAVKARPDGSFALADLEAAISNDTGAIALSQVQYSSGFQIDVKAVGALCKARGLAFALNACQALGQVKVDVRESQADFVCGNAYKWMFSGFGSGLFFGRKEWFERGTPWAGWTSVEKPMAMDPLAGATVRDEGVAKVASGVGVRHAATVLEAGSHSWMPIFSIGAALPVIQSVGIERIAAHNASLQQTLRAELRRRGFVPNAPDDQVAGICTVKVQGAPEDWVKALAKEGVVVSARLGLFRISTHVYNSGDDVRRLCEAVDRLGIRPG